MLHLQIAGNNLKEPLCSTCIYLFLPKITIFLNFVLNCYLAAPQPTLGHYRQDSLTHLMIITVFLQIDPKMQPLSPLGLSSNVKRLKKKTSCSFCLCCCYFQALQAQFLDPSLAQQNNPLNSETIRTETKLWKVILVLIYLWMPAIRCYESIFFLVLISFFMIFQLSKSKRL